MSEPRICTIGHGNRPIGEFIALLKGAEVECVVDVRAYPASRRHPQFAREALEKSLAASGLRCLWEGRALGGRRKLAAGSPHIALKNPGFRAFADHMETAEFREAIERLVAIARESRTAIMCAERLPWQCHRFLVADSLVARDVTVVHLIAPDRTETHVLSRLVRREGNRLIYDAGEQLRLAL